MDDWVYEFLTSMRLPQVRLIRRTDFEDVELLAVKPTRTVAEYCWTCTPSLPLYVLDRNADMDLITYLDADLCFFSSPEPIFEELGSKSILIVEHRFIPRLAHFAENGKYNVEWVTFRRDANGLAALRWWREKCIEWCFYLVEKDRMGDQKYLDRWPMLFEGVHVLQHVGGGVAPWNFSNYQIRQQPDGVLQVDEVPLIFYHFHGFRFVPEGPSILMAPLYQEDAAAPVEIYARYQSSMDDVLQWVRMKDPEFSFGVESAETIIALTSKSASNGGSGISAWCRVLARKVLPQSVRRLVRWVLARPLHQLTG
jgi:hypothetical protein